MMLVESGDVDIRSYALAQTGVQRRTLCQTVTGEAPTAILHHLPTHKIKPPTCIIYQAVSYPDLHTPVR